MTSATSMFEECRDSRGWSKTPQKCSAIATSPCSPSNWNIRDIRLIYRTPGECVGLTAGIQSVSIAGSAATSAIVRPESITWWQAPLI